MEESELDDWYEQQKEALDEQFMQQLLGAKEIEKKTVVKNEFDKKYKELIATYQKKQNKLYDAHELSRKIQEPILKWDARLKEWSKLPEKWFEAKKKAVKQWLFDRKIRRILNE